MLAKIEQQDQKNKGQTQETTLEVNDFSVKADQSTYSPLMIAAGDNQLEIIKQLVESGADINAKSLLKNTPVMFAAQNGHFEAVEYLLEHDAKLGDKNLIGWNAFVYAAGSGNLKLVDWLINAKNFLPSTYEVNAALLLASLSDHVDNLNMNILLFLLKNFSELAGDDEAILKVAENSYFKIDTGNVYWILKCMRTIFGLEKNEIEELDLDSDIVSRYNELILVRLPENISLRKLSYHLKHIEDTRLIKFLENSSVEKLIISDFCEQTTNDSRSKTFNALLTNKNLNLKELTLHHWEIDYDIAKILANFTENNALEFLSLSRCILKGPDIASIILDALNKNLKQLRSLGLMFCHIGVKGAESLANLLLNPELSIKSLDIGANHNLEDGLILIANAIQNNKTLSNLDLSCIFPKNDNRVIAIANMIAGNSSIKIINLSSNSFTDIHGEFIASALKENISLEEVNLYGSYTSSFGIKTAKMLGEALSKNTSIQQLTLDSHGELGNYISYLSKGLATNKSMISLHIANTNVDDAGFISLLNAIAESKTVVKLIIGCSEISDQGATKLAMAIEKNELSITHLSLSSRKMTKAGYIIIYQSLRKNNTLKSLWFSYQSDPKDDYEVYSTLAETLKYYNCTLQNTSEGNSPESEKEIDQSLDRNKKLASRDLHVNEVKSILDGMRKARWEKQLTNQPYSLRFMLGSYSNKLSSSVLENEIDDNIHKEKQAIIASFIQ